MKAFVLYKPNSEHARKIEEFVVEFENTQGRPVNLIDFDSKEGVAKATAYDVLRTPAILVVRDDGSVVKSWDGDPPPLMSELAGYLAS